jgi:hypothetical protein
MKWILKSLAFQGLSRIPGGQTIYHATQRRLTGSTKLTEARLTLKIEHTLRYWQWLEANTSAGWLAQASHLDLGAGWFPVMPMTFHALGISQQYLVDLTPHITPEIVVETAEKFRAVAPRLPAKFARLPVIPARGLALPETFKPLGIVYAAPYEELANRIAGSVGFVTATSALFQMDRATLQMVFRKVHGLLKPGGCFLAQHFLRQPLDSLDSKTSPFYSLRYSDRFWESFTKSPMMYYNRLKAPDYCELLQEAGFQLACLEVEPGKPEDFALLDQARINPIFARYTREELAARYLFFAARKS